MADLGTQLTFKVSSLASHPNFNSIGSQVSPSNRVVGLGSRVSGLGSHPDFKGLKFRVSDLM